MSAMPVRFDAGTCPNATFEDLDVKRMEQFIRTARAVKDFPLAEGTPPVELLRHMNLLNDGLPTNAAVLLFGRKPQRFVPSLEVTCAHFHGTEVVEPIPFYQAYTGTVFELIDHAVDFVLSKVDRRIGTRSKTARAPRSYEIPAEVMAEAIVNAVAHKDFTNNRPVQVMLFADRLEVHNPATLPSSLTLRLLRKAHRSIPSNPFLSDALHLTEYTQRLGSGMLNMTHRCAEAGLHEPEFSIADRFLATIRRPLWTARTDPVRNPSRHARHLVVRSIKTLTFQAMSKSKLRQRNWTGASFISATPWRMRTFSSAVEATRM